MSDKSLIIKMLNQKANELNNTRLLDDISDSSFTDSLKKVIQVSNKLGYTLSLKEKKANYYDEINSKITQALMFNYISTYYVNTDTNEYIGYSASKSYDMLKIEEKGTDFFVDSCINIDRVIYDDDKEYMHKVMTKENILSTVEKNGSFKVTYRLLIEGKPLYVALSAIKTSNDDNSLLISVRNIDDLTKQQQAMQKKIEQNITYTNIALALSQNFSNIYYVNINTNEYVEYNLDSKNQSLEKVSEGNDFFADCIINGNRLVHKDDVKTFLSSLEKEHLLNELKTNKQFRLTYRLVMDGNTVYMSLIALSLTQDLSHIILGISNIDAQKRKEIEYEKAKSIARLDALTGAYNKYSYLELEEKYNAQICKKEVSDFSLVVCDINNLKTINDVCGHAAGDNSIIEAKNMISSVFTKSPIYRVGGDEFVVLLQGSDYDNRYKLIKEFQSINKRNISTDNIVIAIGLSDYDKNKDYIFQDVFNRADKEMYMNKDELKKVN